MNRVFLRHEAYIIQEANIPFFSLYSPSSGLLFIICYCYYVLIQLFFYMMPSSSFLHFCRTFLLLLLFKFIILCQRHDIDESNKKERPVLQTKSSSNYIRIQKNMFQTGLYTLSQAHAGSQKHVMFYVFVICFLLYCY